MMDKSKLTLLLLFILSGLETSFGQKVLIIGVDGMRADVSEIANTPALDALKANGIYSPDALNDDITISGPGWSAILCGVTSEKHLVTGNNFSGNNYEEYPSLFARIEEHNPNLNTVSICHWSPINNNIVLDDADVKINVNSDLALEIEIKNQLLNEDIDVIFGHFDDIDGAGHGNGFASDIPAYIAAIETTDAHISAIINTLESRPNYSNEDWLILVTSDHGGKGFSHGGNSIEEKNVIFIASGESINTSTILKDSIAIIDDPENCLGDTTELNFDGDNDYVQIAHNSAYDFGADQDFTLECRVRTTEAADVSIIGDKDWDSGNNKGYVFSFKFASGPEWKVNIGDGTNRADLNSIGAISDNTWRTLSVSFDRDGMMRMYEDGQFLAETSISNVGNITTQNDIFFGTDIDLEYDYNGSISEVRIWNSLLSDQEIADYACTTIDTDHPSYSNLAGYWKLNEGSGSLAEDDSSNANHGTINNAVWYEPDTIWQNDYSKTPRVEDIAVSALAHLCVPIDTSWSLDGNSLVPDCIYNDIFCANPGYNTWIGESTGIWHVDSNWSRGFVPKRCDHVIVPNGNTVTINGEKAGECRSITIHPSSQLIIENGTSLEVYQE